MRFNEIKGKKVLVTGATGLIGKELVKELISIGALVIAVIRNEEKARELFGYNEHLSLIISDITEFEVSDLGIEFIVHAASQTSSMAFLNEPVETIMTSFLGTKKVLEFARVNPVKAFIYLSTMEVYGAPATDEKIYENHSTNINTMHPRSSYPEGKRMCECLCASYIFEYNVPVVVLRLTQTFGPGVEYNDGRVFAEFARSAIEKKDIVLKTKGETRRSYLYTDDAVTAILTALLHGEIGEAYNVANEDTYCSIYEMACLVAEKCAENQIKVLIEETQNVESLGYAPVLHMNLDTSKIQKLGWRPKVPLEDMFMRMIADMTASPQSRCMQGECHG